MTHPFIPVANVAQCQLIYNQNGQIIENVINVQKGSPFSAADLTTLVNTIDTWDNTTSTGGKNVRNGNCLLQRIHARALDTESSPVVDYVLPASRGGLINGAQALPNNVTFALTLQTGLAGRSFRGRIYLVGLASGQTTGGANASNMTVSAATLIVTCYTALKTAIEGIGAGYHIVVVSYRTGLAWRTSGVATPIINFSYADLNLDSQRRRLPGRGR